MSLPRAVQVLVKRVEPEFKDLVTKMHPVNGPGDRLSQCEAIVSPKKIRRLAWFTRARLFCSQLLFAAKEKRHSARSGWSQSVQKNHGFEPSTRKSKAVHCSCFLLQLLELRSDHMHV